MQWHELKQNQVMHLCFLECEVIFAFDLTTVDARHVC